MYKPEVDKYNIRQLQRYLARGYVDTYKVRRRFIWNYVACCEETETESLMNAQFLYNMHGDSKTKQLSRITKSY